MGAPQGAPTTPHVELAGIGKRFGSVQALADVSVAIERGAVHALVGENGAGKSTLGKIVAGVHSPDAGTLAVDGRPVRFGSPRDALAHGVTIIAQELTLVPQRTVIENVFLGNEDRRFGVALRSVLRERYEALCERAGLAMPPDALVRTLRVAEQQKVEILRALARNARLIVMDEPTASLTIDEAERLLETMRGLRDRGTTLVYVSHFLDQVLEIADTITVLRDGRLVSTSPASEHTPATLVTAMLGRTMEATFPEKSYPSSEAPVQLAVRGMSAGIVRDVSLEVRAGEIVGVAGLVGSGRTELARAIVGADRRQAGEIVVDGSALKIRSPRHALRAGVVMLPESRKDQGLVMRSSVRDNVSLAHVGDVATAGVVRSRSERRRVVALTERVDVRAAKLSGPVTSLSGGNQQKVLFAKWLFRRPKVLIADEPTRGVDVGAKRGIYSLIHSLAAEGMAVLLISSELEEVLGLAHRVLVMRGGMLVAEFDGRSVREDDVMHAAFATGEAAA